MSAKKVHKISIFAPPRHSHRLTPEIKQLSVKQLKPRFGCAPCNKPCKPNKGPAGTRLIWQSAICGGTIVAGRVILVRAFVSQIVVQMAGGATAKSHTKSAATDFRPWWIGDQGIRRAAHLIGANQPQEGYWRAPEGGWCS
jgi:hypothetical protein